VLESKRQNKLLKMAITRLQASGVQSKMEIHEGDFVPNNGGTFITESKQRNNIPEMFSQNESIPEQPETKAEGALTMHNSTMSKQLDTQAQTSFIGMSHITAGQEMGGISSSI
jgi:hypothetical protein